MFKKEEINKFIIYGTNIFLVFLCIFVVLALIYRFVIFIRGKYYVVDEHEFRIIE